MTEFRKACLYLSGAVLLLLVAMFTLGCSHAGRGSSVWISVEPAQAHALPETPPVEKSAYQHRSIGPDSLVPINITLPTSHGDIKLTVPENHKVTISQGEGVQPSRPDAPLKTHAGPEGSGVDVPGSDNSQAAWMNPLISWVLGSILIFAGGVLVLAKKKAVGLIASGTPATGLIYRLAAELPPGSGYILIFLGSGTLVANYFFAEWGWVIGVSVLIAVAALLGKFIHNLFKKQDN